MSQLLTAQKINDALFQLYAVIYIRQSSDVQVLHNVGSTARQYEMRESALALGWPSENIIVVDQDQGHTGVTMEGRYGFQWMRKQIFDGRVGAVFCLESSRLARDSSDFLQLIKICSATGTLIIDEKGIHDPNNDNDFLLLSIMGVINEVDLRALRTKLYLSKLKKAELGELCLRLPVGFIYDRDNNLILDEDEEIQSAVRLVFDLFALHRSGMAVVKNYRAMGRDFPMRSFSGANKGNIYWQDITYPQVRSMLHNPRYAGAYFFGRTQQRAVLVLDESGGVKRHLRVSNVKREDWPVLKQDAHPGYITWEQYLSNLQQLDDNRTLTDENRRGAVRSGSAYLQGIVICGDCGRRMSVTYKKKKYPVYVCSYDKKKFATKVHRSFMGTKIDAAVVSLFLQHIEPAQLELSLASLEDEERQALQADRQRLLPLKRARREEKLARRRFDEADPELRESYLTLQLEWNTKLVELKRLEREDEITPRLSKLILDSTQREAIMALTKDIPEVWHSDTTTQIERKQLLRMLIKDVTLTRTGSTVQVKVRWQTDACSQLEIVPSSRLNLRHDPEVVSLIRKLSLDHSDKQIADYLNQANIKNKRSKLFTQAGVQSIRIAYKIQNRCPERRDWRGDEPRGDGRYSVVTVAQLMNVHPCTIHKWRKQGRLKGVQANPNAPWWIELTPEIISELKKPIRRYNQRTGSSKLSQNIGRQEESKGTSVAA